MPRPRTSSNVLALRGSYKKDPKRRRTDAKGDGSFSRTALPHLEPEVAAAWEELAAHLPKADIAASDHIAFELMARNLATIRSAESSAVAVRLAQKSMFFWLSQFGMTPASRTRLALPQPSDPNSNSFRNI